MHPPPKRCFLPADLVRSLVALLEHPDKVKSLLVVSKVVRLLLVMLSPQLQASKRADSSGGALGATHMRPGALWQSNSCRGRVNGGSRPCGKGETSCRSCRLIITARALIHRRRRSLSLSHPYQPP